MNTNLMYFRIRNICGVLGMILPYLAIISVAFIEKVPEGALNSISATYYNSPVLAGILTAASVVLITYDGYDVFDSFLTSIAGFFGIGIVLFPCSVDWLPPTANVGFFQFSMECSNYIHCTCASLFFLLLAYNCLFLFTKGNDNPTPQKKIRNIIYNVCGFGMFVFMAFQFICVVEPEFFKGPFTMINEIILLQLFGFSWLVKGRAIPFLNDK